MQDMKDWPRVSPSVDIRKALESIEWCTTSDWYVKLGYVTTADSAQPFGCWECWRVCAGGTAFSLWSREPVDWPGQTESGQEREATLRALEEWFSYKPDWAEAFDDSFKYHIHVTESLFRDVFLHCQRAFPWLQSSQWSSARDDWLRTMGLGLGPNMWQAEEWMGYSPGNKKATLPGKQRTRSRINCRFWKWTFWHALDTSVLSQNQKKRVGHLEIVEHLQNPGTTLLSGTTPGLKLFGNAWVNNQPSSLSGRNPSFHTAQTFNLQVFTEGFGLFGVGILPFVSRQHGFFGRIRSTCCFIITRIILLAFFSDVIPIMLDTFRYYVISPYDSRNIYI